MLQPPIAVILLLQQHCIEHMCLCSTAGAVGLYLVGVSAAWCGVLVGLIVRLTSCCMLRLHSGLVAGRQLIFVVLGELTATVHIECMHGFVMFVLCWQCDCYVVLSHDLVW